MNHLLANKRSAGFMKRRLQNPITGERVSQAQPDFRAVVASCLRRTARASWSDHVSVDQVTEGSYAKVNTFKWRQETKAQPHFRAVVAPCLRFHPLALLRVGSTMESGHREGGSGTGTGTDASLG